MAQATLNWSLPTTRADGSALAVGDIAHTAISMSADGGSNWSAEAPVGPTGAQTFSVGNLTGGTYMFRAVVVDVDDRRSANTEVSADVAITAPSAIADLTVTIE